VCPPAAAVALRAFGERRRSRAEAGHAGRPLQRCGSCSLPREPAFILPSRPSRPSNRLSALATLRNDIDTVLAQPLLARGYWGVLVKSLKTDETLYALNAGKLMLPART